MSGNKVATLPPFSFLYKTPTPKSPAVTDSLAVTAKNSLPPQIHTPNSHHSNSYHPQINNTKILKDPHRHPPAEASHAQRQVPPHISAWSPRQTETREAEGPEPPQSEADCPPTISVPTTGRAFQSCSLTLPRYRNTAGSSFGGR